MRIVSPRHGDAISGVVPVLVRVSHPQALPHTAIVLVQVKSSAGYWVNKTMCLASGQLDHPRSRLLVFLVSGQQVGLLEQCLA